MTEGSVEDLISYRMERSHESIRAAEILLEKDMPISAMNRVYYGLFYAVQAILALQGVSFSKHGQVKGYLSRAIIKPGLLPLEMGRIYNRVFEYRQKSDYVDFAVPERELVVEYVTKAKEFRSTVEGYVHKELASRKRESG